MKVRLLDYTPNPEHLCALAAEICTNKEAYIESALKHTDDAEHESRLLKSVIASGHESVLEHASFTFYITGVSRSLTHQLVRHRIASYDERSQRSVPPTRFDYIVPPSVKANPALLVQYNAIMQRNFDDVTKLIGWGMSLEDARSALAQGYTSGIIVTMNARELRHFFALRCCNRAQWEIRNVADEMYRLVKEQAPVLFEGAGPGCLNGRCPEGKRTCGHPRTEQEMLTSKKVNTQTDIGVTESKEVQK